MALNPGTKVVEAGQQGAVDYELLTYERTGEMAAWIWGPAVAEMQ